MRNAAFAAALLAALSIPGANAASAEPVSVARATAIPACTAYVDAAAKGGDGSASNPHKTIAAAVDAVDNGAVICVAEGIYSEQLKPGEKVFTLAGGFQRGKNFKVRDSAAYVTKAKGKGGSFIRYEDPAPAKGLTAVDGFDISGYSQAIYRDYYESQRFDVTNNNIHDNTCADQTLAGGGVALVNVSGTIKGNVFSKNSCGRGGAIFLNDSKNENAVTIEANRIDGNAGTEPDGSHGGAVYVFGNKLTIRDNLFLKNSVTQWGAGLYVGAYTPGNQPTTATMTRNVYRDNRAGDGGGGFFCDDGATCNASHEIYDGNCGGNILVDGGSSGSGPTTTRFDHVTSVNALSPDCSEPGNGFHVDTDQGVAPDSHTITNSLFWGNGDGRDFAAGCSTGCKQLKAAVSNSMAQTKYADGSIKITFAGMVAPADPLFTDPANGDFRLKAGSPAKGKAKDGADLGANVSTAPATEPEPSAPEPEAPEATTPEETTSEAAPSETPAETEQDDTSSGASSGSLALALGDSARARAARDTAGKVAKAAPEPAPEPTPEKQKVAEKTAPAPAPESSDPPPPASPLEPAIARGAKFMGFPERFNRYYTDPSWKPAKTIYVSPDGDGDGTSRDKPSSVGDAVAAARPGTRIFFLRGKYEGCHDFSKDTGGTYDAPVVLYAERNKDQSNGVTMSCCNGGQACFNLEAADYVAVDGFEFAGGKYGVRAVGSGYPASEHSRGIAVLGCIGHDQDKDPFFSGQSDWNVWERSVAYGAKKGDGHGIYLSNGSDWNIVRLNETYGNDSSDFQINADPASTCGDVGIPFDDPRCDAYAGEGEGGQGASDYFLVEGNYFHHSIGPGANFTSVRRSVVRNNIFGLHATKHNVTFWQETDNPKLGSSDNKILHNLFITTNRHGVKFVVNSTRNLFANNVILGVKIAGGKVTANPDALLMEVDDTVGDNVYRGNLYVSGKIEGRVVGAGESFRPDFSPGWFATFPSGLAHDPNDFTPTGEAPFAGAGKLFPDAPADRNAVARPGKPTLGPIEAP